MKAIVDQDACIGCVLCTQICPDVFRMEGYKAISYVELVPEKAEESCKEASARCPVPCITLTDRKKGIDHFEIPLFRRSYFF